MFSGHQTVSPGRLGLASPQGSLPCPGVSGPSAHGGSHASSMLPRCLVFPSVSAKRTAGCGGGGLTHLFSPVSNVAFISEQNLFSAKVRGITEEKGKLSEFDFKDAYTEFLCSTEVVTEFFLRLLIDQSVCVHRVIRSLFPPCHFQRDSESFRAPSEEAALSLWLARRQPLKKK